MALPAAEVEEGVQQGAAGGACNSRKVNTDGTEINALLKLLWTYVMVFSFQTQFQSLKHL